MDPKQQGVKDYYYILGVRPEATTQELQVAYQELFDKFGPHVTLKGEDAEANVKAYKDIVEAWEVLSDPYKRQEYDKVNLPLLQKSHLRDLWGKLTGVKEEAKSKDEPPETKASFTVSLREAVKGVVKQIRVEDANPCTLCSNKKPVDRMKCQNCRGMGSIRADRVEEINIPAGVSDRQELRFPGKGKIDQRSKRHGDLVVEVQIEPHPYFSVLGKDVCCTVPVTLYEAMLGGEIEAPTPTGKVVMKIQPLTQKGRVYRLKGLGMGGQGDLLVSIDIVLPVQLHADEVVLFRKLLTVSSQPNPRVEMFQKIQQSNQQQQSPPAQQ
ncbi:MAG: DnaJ domain-containing protein [Candidatus Obscuribacterales bacterium]|nr:DnaJ domain-containing protein [Candidatus Obscuribacterales bacterium]